MPKKKIKKVSFDLAVVRRAAQKPLEVLRAVRLKRALTEPEHAAFELFKQLVEDPKALMDRVVLETLDETKNDRSDAAELLGIGRRNFYRRLEQDADLWTRIDQQAKDRGHPASGGPPKKRPRRSRAATQVARAASAS